MFQVSNLETKPKPTKTGEKMDLYIVRNKDGFILGYMLTDAGEEFIEEVKEHDNAEQKRNYGINELIESLNNAGIEASRFYPEEVYL